MKVKVKMTKDKREHRRFLVFVPQQCVKAQKTILEQMEKKTGVPWEVNEEESDRTYLAVQTINISELRRIISKKSPDDEKAFVNWRVEWKNKEFEIATGK
jgi:hypothetical protein